MAVGAEATRDGIYEAALEGDWYKAEWFVPPPNSTCHRMIGSELSIHKGSSYT